MCGLLPTLFEVQTPEEELNIQTTAVLQMYPLTFPPLSHYHRIILGLLLMYLCRELSEGLISLLLLLLLSLIHTDERFKVLPSVSYFSVSELRVISPLITSQNPSFTPRIQSLSDYNEKIMIGRIKDRIWD